MPSEGDSYTVQLMTAHLQWGTHRYTGTRGRVYGEGYIRIPKPDARAYGIYNSNQCNGQDILGVNIYNCRSADEFFVGQLKAQGATHRGSIHAKQFSANNNLKAIGSWFAECNAQEGDVIEVRWISSTAIIIRHIPI